MGIAIGIDLGTTNSVVAIKEGDNVRVLQNKENEDLTRSVVGYYKNEIIVGSPALDRMVTVPKDTIISVKRLMGRAFSDLEIQHVKENYQYEIVAPSDGTEDDIRVILGGKEYSPIQISSLILKKLKEDAESRLKEKDKIEYAVITVPAYFTDKQRDATRKAGQMAGLKVQRILDEPSAAAIAFGVDNIGADQSKTILVYDFGGGTFDVSIMTIVGGGVFAQENLEGNMWLGGDDFDKVIMDYVVDYVKNEYGVEARKNARFMVELKKAAEKAKINLSSTNRTEIIVIGRLQDSEANLIDVEVELSRDKFEEMISAKMKESVKLVHTAIENAKLSKNEIDHVLLVGGSSTIPMIRRALVDIFGESKVLMNMDPMKCVAYGAARLANMLGERAECAKGHPNPATAEKCSVPGCNEPIIASIVVGGKTGMHYGIQTIGDKFDVIIEKGSSYPTPKPVVRTFRTPEANMRRIKVPVYAGSEEVASKNELQVITWLNLPENVPEDAPVDVAFTLDGDGVLNNVKVSLKDGSGREVEVFPDRGEGKRSQIEKNMEKAKRKWDQKKKAADSEADEKIEAIYQDAIDAANRNDMEAAEKIIGKMEKEIKELGKDDEEEKPIWKREGEGLASYTNFILQQYGLLIDSAQTFRMKNLMEELNKALEKDDEKLARAKFTALNQEIDNLPGIVLSLMTIRYAINVAHNKGMIKQSDALGNALSVIEDALRAQDISRVQIELQKVKPVVDEVFAGKPPTPDSTTFSELLK
jgi:molecular chaperone DnaK (HSP70)